MVLDQLQDSPVLRGCRFVLVVRLNRKVEEEQDQALKSDPDILISLTITHLHTTDGFVTTTTQVHKPPSLVQSSLLFYRKQFVSGENAHIYVCLDIE